MIQAANNVRNVAVLAKNFENVNDHTLANNMRETKAPLLKYETFCCGCICKLPKLTQNTLEPK